jgi:hypothetical protein
VTERGKEQRARLQEKGKGAGAEALVGESRKMWQNNLYDLLARLFAGTTPLIFIVISYHLALCPFGHITCHHLECVLAPVRIDHLAIGGYGQTGFD